MKKRGQVWIETVIYTLIAFVLISTTLAFVKPKIEEMQDKAIIEQSIELIEAIDSQILSIIQGGPGNKRLIEIGLKKGLLEINGKEDKIVFEMESRSTYSEPGLEVNLGNIIVYTEKRGKFNLITLTRNYSEYNITFQGSDAIKSLSKAATNYKLSVSNKGTDGNRTIIDFEVN